MLGWVGEWEVVAMLEGFIDVSAVLSAGIYALVREGVVVYIGQSKRMLTRVSSHKSNWGRKNQPTWLPASVRGVLFDEVHVLPCRVEDLNRLEAALIDLYKPRLNRALKAPTPTTTPLNLTTATGITIPINHRPTSLPFERRI